MGCERQQKEQSVSLENFVEVVGKKIGGVGK